MAADKFVSLHRHDSFSSFDGIDLPIRACKRAMRLEQPAVGVTNHGTVAGLVDHYRVCVDRGMKPILGVEAYLTDTLEIEKDKDGKVVSKPALYHQTIIVESNVGYRNLMRLVTKANQNFYYKPRMTLDMLEEHAEGLIVLTGCPSSMIQRAIAAGDTKKAARVMARLKEAFPDRLYAEVQHHESSVPVMEILLGMARRLGLPLVATNDAHYVDPEDRPLHDWTLKNKRKGRGEDEPIGYGYGFHMTTRQEMGDLLRQRHPQMGERRIEEALDNTIEVADRCQFTLPRSATMLPPLWGSREESTANMRRKVVEGMRNLGLHAKREYVERLKRELGVIEGLNYVDYFHAVSEVTDWARSEGILIGPRGSVCGSLLAYALGITTVDPLKYGTLFERFLYEQKKTMPDVDLDIDARYHGVVLDWILKRYSPYAYKIVAYGRTGAGNILADLLKGFPEVEKGLFFSVRRGLSKMRHEGRVLIAEEQDIEEYVTEDTLERLKVEIPWIVRGLTKMYSALRYVGQHPGGVCFVAGDHTEFFATMKSREHLLTCYTMLDLEYMNLLKLDFLGLKAMSSVADVTAQKGIAPRDIPMDDEKVYRRFAAGDVTGIFQFETRGATDILKRIQPENFAELAAATALNRPGVSANLDKYVDGKERRKDGEESPMSKPGSLGAIVREVLDPTYGAIVYQEQIVRILRAIGMTWQEGDTFLKSIKAFLHTYSASFEEAKGRAIMDRFVELLVARGIDKERAREFGSRIAQYSFNMCVAGETILQTGTSGRWGGAEIRVDELYRRWNSKTITGWKYRNRGLNILALCDDGRVRPRRIKGVYRQARASVIRVGTDRDKAITITLNHRLLTDKGYCEAGALRIGSDLIVLGEREQRAAKGRRSTAKGRKYGAFQEGFPKGEANPAYVDGRAQSLALAQVAVLERSGDACEVCGESGGRMEFAHIRPLDDCGGYVEYHSEQNIRRLCNSHHKRFDYLKGERRARWSKGRPIGVERIISLERLGERVVYDVEMVGPEHNCIMNGIVSHNSHATAYSMVAYWQMWLRVHHPIEFWCAMLMYESFRETRMAYEQQAIRDGIVLLPPHVNGTANYSIEDGAIRVGLTTIHGVGEKAAFLLEQGRPYRKASDILRFEKRAINARVKKALLGANALLMDRLAFIKWAQDYNNTRLSENLGDWKHAHYKLIGRV